MMSLHLHVLVLLMLSQRATLAPSRVQASLADDGVCRVTQNAGREATRLHNCKNKAATSR